VINSIAKSSGESFLEHTNKVISYVEKVVDLFDLQEDHKYHIIAVSKVAALLHDIGKLTNRNQEILKNNEGECRHAYLSYYIAEQLLNDRSLRRIPQLKQIKNTVLYAVLYHHELKKEELEALSNNSLNESVDIEAEDYIIDELSKIDLTDCIHEDTHSSLKYMCQEYTETAVDTFALRSYVLTTLIVCDRLASSDDKDLYNSIIKTLNTTYKLDNERSKDQNNLVKRLTTKVNVIDADPGSGKTSIALQYLVEQKLRSFIVLPKRIFIDGLYNSVQEDITRLSIKASVQKLHSGVLESNSDNASFEDDINITSFDKMLSSNYNRREFDLLLKIHTSTVIIDEFHEFCNVNRMLFSFQVFVRMRQFKNNAKCLLMSGTSNQSLISFLSDVSYFDRSVLKAHNFNKFKLEITNKTRTNEKNYLIFSNRVADTQKFKEDIILHSQFTDEDRKREQEKLFSKLSKINRDDTIRVSGSHICTASLNYSVKHMDIEITNPDSLAQLLGRRDRFCMYTDSVVRIREDKCMIEDKKFMFCPKPLLNSFYKHLSEHNNKFFTHREFMIECYDIFYKNKKNLKIYKDYLKKQLEKGIDEIKEYYPQKTNKRCSSKNKTTKQRLSFRSDSYNALALCKEDNKYYEVKISERQEELEIKIKKKGIRYLEELRNVCENSGIDNSYQHKYIIIGTEQNPYILPVEEYEYDKKIGLIKKKC